MRKSPMVLKLGIWHRGLELYKVFMNDDPWLTLTFFTARSNWVTYTFESGKLLQSHLMGNNLHERINFLNYTVNEKE